MQSNHVYALLVALKSFDWEKRFEDVRGWSKIIRRRLAEVDLSVLAPDDCAMLSVVIIPLPKIHSFINIGDTLKGHGVLISYLSNYQIERNWIQVCMMGAENRSTRKFVCLIKKELER